jgi:hypothetical protein
MPHSSNSSLREDAQAKKLDFCRLQKIIFQALWLDFGNAGIEFQCALDPFRHAKQSMVLAIGANGLDAQRKPVFAKSRRQ